ncbi:MAG: hypothetical protein OEW58_10990, partial [Gammaproteobacteria bacterium]|nr:hypothetical protein [Gammaproteobacteria bacterium]
TAQALQTDDANTATVNEAQLNQLEPRIVSVANGRVVASWIQRHRYSNVDGLINDWNNNVTDTLRLATFANATWSDAFSVAQSRLDAFSPRLAKLSSDSVALAWTQLNDPRTGSHNALKFVRYSFATGISNIETLGEIKDPYSFALSANGQNNASLTWSNDTQITAAVLK